MDAPITSPEKIDVLSERYLSVRSRTELLCAPLQPEDYIPQPEEFVSPPKWHLAHTTWFFEEFILSKHLANYKRFHPEYAFLFNSYYNGVGERLHRFSRGVLTRPYIKDIYAYRSYVDKALTELLKGNYPSEVSDLVELGLQHEQQHQELLITDLKYVFSLNPSNPVYQEGFSLVNAKPEHTCKAIQFNSGVYEIGYTGEGFCFDNEQGRHRQFLEAFEIDTHPVTNGAFIDFIANGGYQNHEYWLDEGWAWVQQEKITQPLYWKEVSGRWMQYTLEGLRPVQPHEILCHVNYFEATAFANWKNKRLPTEFEWEAAEGQIAWGKVWEWTQSAYLAYPNYRKPNGAVGEYNGKFMVNQMVLRGSSKATAPGHSRFSYRNFFHPQHRWQLSGLRLAQNI